MELLDIIKLVLLGAFALSTVLSVIFGVLSKSKSSKVATAAKTALAITEEAKVLIAKAEAIVGFTGVSKKEWVMVKLNDYAIKNGLTYNEEQVDTIVESLIALTNKVNVNKAVEEVIEEGKEVL